MVVVTLALAWGVLAALPLLAVAVRTEARTRARHLRADTGRPRRHRALVGAAASRIAAWPVVPAVVALIRRFVGSRRRQREAGAWSRELPTVVDLLNVAVGAGLTPHEAIELAAQWAPSGFASRLSAVTAACRLGATLDEALRDAARREPGLRPVADAVRTASRLGAPLAPALARLADDTRADLRRAAEARARTVPVRLLFPLVFLVLPAFGLLTVVPALLAGFTQR